LIFAPSLAWTSIARVISVDSFGFNFRAIGSLANDFDNDDLSIDSFGRAFQHGAKGAKFGFAIGMISTIPVVG
jgi:hypothetical protein